MNQKVIYKQNNGLGETLALLAKRHGQKSGKLLWLKSLENMELFNL